MKKIKDKKQYRRYKIKMRIRKIVKGSPLSPRLTVFRSNKDIYAQLIDDESGKTIISASSRIKELADKKVNKVEMSKMVGKLLAERAIEAEIDTVVFDRNGYLYHGRVKALAEGAREGGLKF